MPMPSAFFDRLAARSVDRAIGLANADEPAAEYFLIEANITPSLATSPLNGGKISLVRHRPCSTAGVIAYPSSSPHLDHGVLGLCFLATACVMTVSSFATSKT